VGTFNATLHPRGPNGRFTRSFARHMSSLDGVKAKKVKAGFHGHTFHGPDDAHTYLSHLSGVKTPGKTSGGIRQYLDNGTLKTANEALRAGKEDVPAVSAIEAQMEPLPNDLDLFRSVPATKFGKVDPKSLEGMVVSDAGYFPTTIAPQKGGPGTVQLHVQAPAGTKAAVDPDSGQVVLGHGAEMAVDSVDVAPDGSTRMNLVALPTNDTAPGHGSPASSGGGGDAPASPAAAPSFDERVHAARTGDSARQATHHSLIEDGAPPLTAEQQFALTAYRGEEYTDINRRLRTGEPVPSNPDVDSYVQHIDAAMANSRLGVEVQAWRGMGNSQLIFGDRFDGDLTGMEWSEAAYVSTSTDRSVSEDFAGNLRGAVMMRVVVPRGVGAIELSDGGYESEVMLERGLRMRVVADRGFDEDGVRQIDVEVIPGEQQVN